MKDQDQYLLEVFKEAKQIFPVLEMDLMSNVWSFDAGSGHTVYCTPFFEGCDGIAVSIVNEDGDHMGECDLDYKLTNIAEIDALEYVKTIKLWMHKHMEGGL